MSPRPPSKISLIGIILSLLFIGIIFIAISSQNDAQTTTGDQYFFIKKQLVWLLIGSVAFIVGSKLKLSALTKYINLFYFGSIFLLLLVMIPQFGSSALGASRWLNLGIIGIQPSEIYKFIAIIFFANLFSKPDKRTIKKLLIYLLPALFLILLEPNFSTVVLISTIILTMYYLSGGEILPIFTISFLAVIIGLVLVVITPYRLARLSTLLNRDKTEIASYHSNQMLLTLASGGLFGKGFANSDQKYRYLPKISTDSILAVVGEEVGFVGIFTIIVLFILLILAIFSISHKTPSLFHQLICQGIAVWIGSQALINIAAVSALIPLTGVTLPLISYGGSSLTSLLFGLGLVRNVQNQSKLLYSNVHAPIKNSHSHRQPPHARH
ncbi:FtsW/RodA/SpoVE family cell cycle protein [Candidatus Shapirobacteria bacterium]|nr:FtsW/RodA/SpoVE family cell cycle protein [Candidatus Shapirobacteria bacterium]